MIGDELFDTVDCGLTTHTIDCGLMTKSVVPSVDRGLMTNSRTLGCELMTKLYVTLDGGLAMNFVL